MTNEEARAILTDIKNTPAVSWATDAVTAFEVAIKALKEQERPTLRHVIINHPRYGKSDAWYDEARQIVFQHWISKEFADTLGWKIEEEEL